MNTAFATLPHSTPLPAPLPDVLNLSLSVAPAIIDNSTTAIASFNTYIQHGGPTTMPLLPRHAMANKCFDGRMAAVYLDEYVLNTGLVQLVNQSYNITQADVSFCLPLDHC